MTRKCINKRIRRAGFLLLLSIIVLPATSAAQQYYDPGLIRKTIDRKPVDFQSPGVRMGSFLLKPGADLTWENNDNVFYSEDVQLGDNIFHVRPWVNLASDWSRHALTLSAWADIARYQDFGSEDYDDWQVRLDGRIDVKRGSAFRYDASYSQLHEYRGSLDDQSGIKPTDFTVSGFDVGYGHTFNRLRAELGYDRYDTNYDNNINGDGDIIYNQARDRTRDALTLRLNYEMAAGVRSVFFGAQSNNVKYDQKFDLNGYDRSSDGYNLQGGMTFAMTGLLEGDLYVQYLDQNYDDPRLYGSSGFGLGAGLTWTPTEVTNVGIRLDHTPQETTIAGTSGYYSSLYSFRVQHELRRNLLANFRASYTDNEFARSDIELTDQLSSNVTRFGVGLSYLINRYISVSGGYVYEKQKTNVVTADYKANRWFLTAEFEL